MRVLLATDGSECSQGAARFLSRFAFEQEDSIEVLHAVPEVPLTGGSGTLSGTVREIRQSVAPRILDLTIENLGSLRAQISGTVTDGPPDDAILKTATANSADLIVMGARGLKGRHSAFLGSVTRETAIQSPVPVLVVKPPQWDAPAPLTVLFATDGSDASVRTADLLAALPLPKERRLELLYVSTTTYLEFPDSITMEVNDRIKDVAAALKEEEYQMAQLAFEKARSALSGSFTDVHEAVLGGDPAEVILKTAAERKADIIAVGSSGMRGFRGIIGSVARNILGHSPVSVYIGKAGVP